MQQNKMYGSTAYPNEIWLWSIGEKAENYNEYFNDQPHPDILWIFNSWERQSSVDNRRSQWSHIFT